MFSFGSSRTTFHVLTECIESYVPDIFQAVPENYLASVVIPLKSLWQKHGIAGLEMNFLDLSLITSCPYLFICFLVQVGNILI